MKRTLASILIFLLPILIFVSFGAILLVAIFGDEEDETLLSYEIVLSELGQSEIPAEFIEIYKRAGERYGIPWTLLAAIHRVETTFSTNLTVSYAGAIGHTQFMPCSWVGWGHSTCGGLGRGNIGEETLTSPEAIKKYGGYGVDANDDGRADPMDIEDAIFATANYLSASGAKTDLRKAIYNYNHSQLYVNQVMGFYESYTDGYTGTYVGTLEIIGEKAWPVPHTKNITSSYGLRNGVPHRGIDIAGGNDYGKPIVAFLSGTVIVSELNGTIGGGLSSGKGYGYQVVINHENGLSTRYAHLSKPGIPAGSKVEAGQQIGTMGSTGHSSGPHLHFEILVDGKAVDPLPYLQEFLP